MEDYIKEDLDLLEKILGSNSYENYLLGNTYKYLNLYKNTREEKDLVTAGTYLAVLIDRVNEKNELFNEESNFEIAEFKC